MSDLLHALLIYLLFGTLLAGHHALHWWRVPTWRQFASHVLLWPVWMGRGLP